MARTKNCVNSAQRFNLIYHKSKRHQLKMISRKTHHALRNANRQADELNFTMFQQSSHRIYYGSEQYQEEREIFNTGLGKFSERLHRDGKDSNESMRKRLQDELRKMKRQQKDNPYGNYRHLNNSNLNTLNLGEKCRARTMRDVFTAAHKRLKRRGSMKIFEGHRQKGVLYKRELTFWM